MRTRRLIGHGLRGMGRHRLRTFFMMLGTFVGVLALTLVVAIGQGTRDAVLGNVERMFGGSSILLSAGGGGMMGGPRGAGPTTTLVLEDLEEIQATVSGIRAYDPMILAGSREVVYQGNSSNVRVLGHSERHEEVWNRGVSRGAFFGEAEVRSSARVALVGETLVRELFQGADPIGMQIRVGTIPFEVIGVLDSMGIDPHGWDRDNEVMIPVTTMMRRVMNVDYVQTAKFLAENGTDLDATVLAIEHILRERHALADAVPNDFSMITPVQVEEMVGSMNRIFTLFLPLLAGVSLLIGGIVVANLMLMSVNERRSEIGLRKAVGARARDVWVQFLLESSLVTLAGGILALAVAAVVLGVISRFLEISSIMPWQAAFLGLGASVLVGLLAGVAPARRASDLDPVATLRG
ncbi:MAG: ABC transporter permease [Gemmatimonadota bacterium]